VRADGQGMNKPTQATQPKAQATTVEGGAPKAPSRSPGGASASAMSGLGSGAGGRQVFAADELAIVLSHFNIGTIEAIQEFPRGSRKAPKLILRADTGLYLLKRRARGKDDPFKVAFCHALQMHLTERQFPLPHLIGTKKDNNSMLQWKGTIYELFEYIKGTSYDNSLEATGDAGKILALFHKLLKDYQPEYEPPQGSYHAARPVAASIKAIPDTLARLDPASAESQQQCIARVMKFLYTSYNDAARRVNDIGLPNWPGQIVHCDWHPGNMLFRGSRVVAVIDYDAARIQQRIIDAANGALQFSILGGGDDPSQWPEYIDESRFKRFIRGYDSVPDAVLSRAELRTIPWLMIEALIAESVIPIAATGSFARLEGVGFLLMVERKVRWLQERADALVASVDE
jgi:Ser/Thr protein kinase RdoA (MazF antagonist)